MPRLDGTRPIRRGRQFLDLLAPVQAWADRPAVADVPVALVLAVKCNVRQNRLPAPGGRDDVVRGAVHNLAAEDATSICGRQETKQPGTVRTGAQQCPQTHVSNGATRGVAFLVPGQNCPANEGGRTTGDTHASSASDQRTQSAQHPALSKRPQRRAHRASRFACSWTKAHLVRARPPPQGTRPRRPTPRAKAIAPTSMWCLAGPLRAVRSAS